MKIALELQPCCGKRSGIGHYTYELARHLESRNGVEFCGNLFNFLGRNDNTAALRGITIPIQENRLFPYGIYRRIWNIVPIPYSDLYRNGADAAIFFNYIVPPHIKGHVLTFIHDMTYLRCPETMAAKNLRRIEKNIQYSVERSSRVLTISAFSKGEIAELLGVPAEKISVVYPAPSLQPGTADFGVCCQKWGLHRPYLLYVGTIEPRKNLARLLRAFALSKEMYHIPHHLVLAGGRGWRDEEILQTVKEISCKEDVIFTGYVSAVEKNTLYQNAAAFRLKFILVKPMKRLSCRYQTNRIIRKPGVFRRSVNDLNSAYTLQNCPHIRVRLDRGNAPRLFDKTACKFPRSRADIRYPLTLCFFKEKIYQFIGITRTKSFIQIRPASKFFFVHQQSLTKFTFS